jgi:hypothetical protein
MVETTLAVGDLITALPSMWESLRVPLAIVALIVGGGSGAVGLARGFGHAMGKVLGGIAVAAITLGALGLAMSAQGTVDKYGGNITVGQFGR